MPQKTACRPFYFLLGGQVSEIRKNYLQATPVKNPSWRGRFAPNWFARLSDRFDYYIPLKRFHAAMASVLPGVEQNDNSPMSEQTKNPTTKTETLTSFTGPKQVVSISVSRTTKRPFYRSSSPYSDHSQRPYTVSSNLPLQTQTAIKVLTSASEKDGFVSFLRAIILCLKQLQLKLTLHRMKSC